MGERIHGAGKGDIYRSVDWKKWDKGWKLAFKKSQKGKLINQKKEK